MRLTAKYLNLQRVLSKKKYGNRTSALSPQGVEVVQEAGLIVNEYDLMIILLNAILIFAHREGTKDVTTETEKVLVKRKTDVPW